MKTIKILRIRDPFNPHSRSQLDAAAKAMSARTGYSILPIDSGFEVRGEWRGKFLTEEDFVDRIARDLQLASRIIFDSVTEG